MMKRKLIAICMAVIGIILMAGAALGQEIQVPLVGFCINSSYVQYDTNVTIGGVSQEVKVPPSGGIFCPFGCQDNVSQYGADCLKNQAGSDTSYLIAVIFGLFAIAFILIYIAFQLTDTQHGALQILFVSIAVFILWAIANVTESVLYINNITLVIPLITTIETILVWGGVFFIFYLIVFFIWNLVKKFKYEKKKKAQDPFRSGDGL
jgi:hypothetical protein